MWRRGANLEGDTANFIETEQVVEHEGFKASLLQVFFHLRNIIDYLGTSALMLVELNSGNNSSN